MESNDLKQIQIIELEILKEIIRICEKYNINYNLEGGSCLGAIRHNGFIPWDDDIDIAMMRSEYNKFVRACEKDLDTTKFYFQDCVIDENCGFTFGKLRRNNTILSEEYSHKLSFHQGVWIDIFIYDYVSDNKYIRNYYRFLIKFIQNLYIIRCGYSYPANKPRIYKLAYFLIKPFAYICSKKFYIKLLLRFSTKFNDSPKKYVFNYSGAYPKKGIFENNMFKKTMKHKFEGIDVNIMEKYDLYLSQLFGNYMELPPIEKRNGGNHFIHEFRDYRHNSLNERKSRS